MISYKEFYDKLSAEQRKQFEEVQQKAIDLSADIAKVIDDTKDLLTEEEGKGVYDQDTEDAYIFANTTNIIFGRFLSHSDKPINTNI